MSEVEITQADIDRAHEWMRGQTTGLRMMLVKPRGIYEILAAHRIAAEEGKAELVKALEHYANTFCEGIGECVGDFCGKLSVEECSGCHAFAALARVADNKE